MAEFDDLDVSSRCDDTIGEADARRSQREEVTRVSKGSPTDPTESI